MVSEYLAQKRELINTLLFALFYISLGFVTNNHQKKKEKKEKHKSFYQSTLTIKLLYSKVNDSDKISR